VNQAGHKRDPADGLTTSERNFCYAYLLSGDQRKSAKLSFKCKTNTYADQRGWQVLRRPQVTQFIAKCRAEMMGGTAAVNEQGRKIIAELAILCFSDPRNYVDALDLPDETKKAIKKLGPEAKAISEIEVEERTVGEGKEAQKVRKVRFRFHSKVTALQLLGKHHKLYSEQNIPSDNHVSPGVYQLPDNGMGPKINE
jgi:hypothetical protein